MKVGGFFLEEAPEVFGSYQVVSWAYKGCSMNYYIVIVENDLKGGREEEV